MKDKEKIKKALSKAVRAIYLGDSNDYATFLWEIIEILGGQQATKLLETDDLEAFEKYCGE